MTIHIGDRPLLSAERCDPTDAELHLAHTIAAGHRHPDTLDRAAADELTRTVERLAALLAGPVDSTRVRAEVQRELREARALCQARADRHHQLGEQAWETLTARRAAAAAEVTL